MSEVTTYKKNFVRLNGIIMRNKNEAYSMASNVKTDPNYIKVEKLQNMINDIASIKILLDTIYKINQNKVEQEFNGTYSIESILDFEKSKVEEKLKLETNENNYKYYYKCFHMMEDFLEKYEGNDL